jgi:Na+/melibiose symporter-like transporter
MGRRHPFMIISVAPFCLSLIAIFNPPAELSQTGLFCWYLVMAFTVRTALTFFSVPHLALGAELSEDYNERTSNAGDVADGYRNVGTVSAVLTLVGMLAAIFGTRKRIPLLARTSSS